MDITHTTILAMLIPDIIHMLVITITEGMGGAVTGMEDGTKQFKLNRF